MNPHAQPPPPTGGAELELEVGPVAHGGHCVSRVDGRVVFVRHALPGERVRAVVTEQRRGFLRADAIEVLRASPDRVSPPCPYARPGLCGGCDFQHATPAVQRALKAAVLREHLAHLGGVDVDVPVRALPGGALGWRTRVQYAVDPRGRAGLHQHRSPGVVAVQRCLIAHPEIQAMPVTGQRWTPGGTVEAVVSSAGDRTVLTRASRSDRQIDVVSGPAYVRHAAFGREWTVEATAFWQVHPAAAATFAATVLELLSPRPAERAWDLYGGAGLFAAALAPHCGPVTVVEADRRAVVAGRRALADLPNVRFVAGDVAAVIANPAAVVANPAAVVADPPLRAVDLVVLDPPRTGAGAAVVRFIAARRPRAVAYVACDPAAFARDVRTFAELGYRLAEVRAFDAFPMTHHFETIGLLTPGDRL